MGQRSRRKRRSTDNPRAQAPISGEAQRRSDTRSDRETPQPGNPRRAARPARPSSTERTDQLRAALEPVKPGERPRPLLIAIALATLLGVGNASLYFAGTKIQGKHPGPGVLTFSAVMLVAAVGMYQVRYWAVLGFQALLALIVLAFGLFLVRASNVEALALCVVVIGGGGWLFVKMVRVLARIQMPSRPSR